MGWTQKTPALLAALLAAIALSAAARAAEPPAIVVEAPDNLEGLAERVRAYDTSSLLEAMRLTGLDDPGPPIRVILAEEGSQEARAAPPWVTGYAYGAGSVVVVIPSRLSAYPYASLESLLHHEVAHVLIARASRGGPIPRWFNEGLALAAARTWHLEDGARLVLEILPGRRAPLARIDDLFNEGEGQAQRAYVLAGAFVRDLLRRHGETFSGRVLHRVGEGASFDEAFREATGRYPAQAIDSFYDRQNFWKRWVPFLTSSFTLWTVITMLGLYAFKKRREKDVRMKERWDREDGIFDDQGTNGA